MIFNIFATNFVHKRSHMGILTGVPAETFNNWYNVDSPDTTDVILEDLPVLSCHSISPETVNQVLAGSWTSTASSETSQPRYFPTCL